MARDFGGFLSILVKLQFFIPSQPFRIITCFISPGRLEYWLHLDTLSNSTMDPNSLPSDSSQAPPLGDLAAQSPSGITTIPLLPTELRLQIPKDVMHMIKEPVIILDLHAMPRGKPLKGKQIRFLPPAVPRKLATGVILPTTHAGSLGCIKKLSTALILPTTHIGSPRCFKRIP
jgi:hypothetical protein